MPADFNSDNLERATRAELLSLLRESLVRIKALEAENAKLREEVRASKRATAPFSKGKSKSAPKKPGRKAGVGRFVNRPEPEPGPADVVKEINVPLDSAQCPQCGANLEVKIETATVEDIPPEPVRWAGYQVYTRLTGRSPRG